MKLKFIDHPVFLSLSKYEDLRTKIVKQLLDNNAVLSIYQMGSVKHPGISDLDIICVFNNGTQCHENLRLMLGDEEKRILTHGIFGIEEKDLRRSMSYNLISNLKYLKGKDLDLNKAEIVTSDDLKKQIALEYMVKMHITLDAQVTLKIIKLRAFLLLAKAIEFDLQLLGVISGNLYELVQQVIQYRNDWFTDKPNWKEVTTLVLNFKKELKLFLEKEVSTTDFYLPAETINLPGNFIIHKNNMFLISHKGFLLPKQLGFLGRKYINLQFKLNSFSYGIPFKIPAKNSEHNKRFKFSKELVNTNKMKYPYFIPLTTSLSIY